MAYNSLSAEKYLKKMRWIKIKFFIHCLFGNRNKFLRKNRIFGYFGEKVNYQPTTLPRNPKLIKIHNNVRIAAGVTFYEHDGINWVFRRLNDKMEGNWKLHQSAIEIFDNCFIGGKSIIIGNIRVGPNAIVAAGSVVTKDVEPGTIVAGNPARVVGRFDSLYEKRKEIDYSEIDLRYSLSDNEIWNDYNEKHKQFTNK